MFLASNILLTGRPDYSASNTGFLKPNLGGSSHGRQLYRRSI
jgi:hypothetical protein